MLKTILTGFILGIILILFVPSTLILASWNAVPGDSTYNIKVGLEKAILGITPSDNLKTTLEIKYTERRFSEVEKIISTNATNSNSSKTKFIDTSLTNLTNQAIASKNSLQKIQNSDEKTIQTENLIATLESISSKIEEKKQTSNISSTPTKIPTKTPTIINHQTIEATPIPTSIPTTTSIPTIEPTPIKNSEPIINSPDLEDAKKVIDEIIDELKDESSTQSNSDNKKNDKPESRRDNNNSNGDNKDNNNKDKNDRRP